MAETLIHIFKAFLDILFPQKCLGCGAGKTPLCNACLAEFPPLYLPDNRKIFAATSYEDENVKKAIRLFKYHGVKTLAEPLAALIFERTKNAISKFIGKPEQALIIPIPLSPIKLRQRGYNQSELIGKSLSDKLSVKMRSDVLYKIKETPSQVEIKDRKKRLKNLEGAFAVKNPEKIKNKTIILVDDVITTGTTMNEARRTLTQAGAKQVIGIAVAKG